MNEYMSRSIAIFVVWLHVWYAMLASPAASDTVVVHCQKEADTTRLSLLQSPCIIQ